MNETKTDRISGLDIVRSFAVFFVLGIHAITFLGFHSHTVSGISSFIEIFIFRLTWMCVPLFLLLTGYLNCKKEGNKPYYKSVLNTFLIYLFYSVLVILFRRFYQKEPFTFWQGIKMLLDYSSQDRAWYMNMYFGLVLLIPFLNKGWSLLGKKQKLFAISTLFILTSVSKFVFNVSSHYFGTPVVLISNYWWGIYFLVYYFIGAYLREYPITVSKKYILALLLIIISGHTAVYTYAGQGGTFGEIYLSSIFWYDNPVLVIEASLFFLLFYNLNLKNKVFNLVTREVSLSAFEIYLFSIVTDTILVTRLIPKLNGSNFLWVVMLMWLSSFTLAFLFTFLRRKLLRFF